MKKVSALSKLGDDGDELNGHRNDNSPADRPRLRRILKTGQLVVPFNEEEARKFHEKFPKFDMEVVRLQPGGLVISEPFLHLHEHYLNFQFDPSDVVVMAYPKCGSTWMQELVWTMKHNPDLNNPIANSFIGFRSLTLEMDSFAGKEAGPPCEVRKFIVISAASFVLQKILSIIPYLVIPLLLLIVLLKKMGIYFRKVCMKYSPSLLASTFTAVMRIFPINFLHLTDSSLDQVIPGIYLCILEHLDRPRIIKTHLPFSVLPQDILQHTKVIFVQRNPKDMLVSYYHYCRLVKKLSYAGTFEEFVKSFIKSEIIYGNYALHIQDVMTRRANSNLLIVRYEDMKYDIISEMKIINKFLDTKLSNQQIEKIVEYTSFSNMKKKQGQMGPFYNAELVKNKENFFRKGIIGDWKSKFTPELTAEVDQWILKNFNIEGLDFKYT